MEFFNEMDLMLKTFWFIALPASLIFVVQAILTFVGVDAADGIEAEMADGGEGMQFFSFRNLVNFLLGFGWTGVALFDYVANPILLAGVSFIVGFIFLMVFFAVIKQVQKLAEDNSFKMEDTIGKLADVYLLIPGAMRGKGKVMVNVKGSVHELDAMTASEQAIPTGSVVKVLKIESGNILIVNQLIIEN